MKRLAKFPDRKCTEFYVFFYCSLLIMSLVAEYVFHCLRPKRLFKIEHARSPGSKDKWIVFLLNPSRC